MAEIFHVAGRSHPNQPSHSPGTVLSCEPPQSSSDPGVLGAVELRFPAGVSKHGTRYMTTLPEDASSSYAVEAIFEAVRLAEYPDKHSRMCSWFATETVEDARAFIADYRADRSVDIWRAKGEVVHRANMALLQALHLPVVATLERASAYWRGDQGDASEAWEVLVKPGMELLEIVETTGPV